MPFTIAIVGRPNVGKSTLFNRLVGKKLAIVDDQPGVTRDRRIGEAHLGDIDFAVIDTAGLEDTFDDSLESRMREQTEAAIKEADVALLMIDGRTGVTPLDEHFARRLRKGKTPILLVSNKSETKASETNAAEAYRLGLGDPIPISAEHGQGLSNLYDAIRPFAEKAGVVAVRPTEEDELGDPDLDPLPDDDAEAPKHMQMAIIGRPNVGKSTLVNSLLGRERLLTGPESGITRDSIAIDWTWAGKPVRLIDTAGMRRRSKVVNKIERLSTADTQRALNYAHVAVLVLDANDMLEKQDLTIARHVVEEGRGLVIAANKWDAIENKSEAMKKLRDRIDYSLPQIKGVPVVTISAMTGRNLDKLMAAVLKVYELWNKRVPTARLNRWLDGTIQAHPPPLVAGKRIKIRYMTQIKTRPPTFAIFAQKGEELPDAYHRYLTNGIREAFDLEGVPLRLLLRRGENPFDKKD
jgi:GTP-binding protein